MWRGSPTAALTIAQMPFEWQQKVAEGWTFTDAEGNQQKVYGTQEFALLDREHAQRVAIEGFWYTDETGQKIRVHGQRELQNEDWARSEKTRTGYYRPMYDQDGQVVRDEQGQPVLEYVMGTDGLAKYQIDMQDKWTQAGLKQEDAHFKAQLAADEKKYTGYWAKIKKPDDGRDGGQVGDGHRRHRGTEDGTGGDPDGDGP